LRYFNAHVRVCLALHNLLRFPTFLDFEDSEWDVDNADDDRLYGGADNLHASQVVPDEIDDFQPTENSIFYRLLKMKERHIRKTQEVDEGGEEDPPLQKIPDENDEDKEPDEPVQQVATPPEREWIPAENFDLEAEIEAAQVINVNTNRETGKRQIRNPNRLSLDDYAQRVKVNVARKRQKSKK
jgi:hypothetical protein